jgi:hypothetical protein
MLRTAVTTGSLNGSKLPRRRNPNPIQPGLRRLTNRKTNPPRTYRSDSSGRTSQRATHTRQTGTVAPPLRPLRGWLMKTTLGRVTLPCVKSIPTGRGYSSAARNPT